MLRILEIKRLSNASSASLAESEHVKQGHENRGVEIGHEAVDDSRGAHYGCKAMKC